METEPKKRVLVVPGALEAAGQRVLQCAICTTRRQ